MKNLFIALIILSAGNAFASSVNCSNADQSLVYSSFVSDGGANIQHSELKYKGVTQRAGNPMTRLQLKINFSQEKEIGKQVSNGTTTTTFSALATGEVAGTDQTLPFSEFVICKTIENPKCYRCP